MSISYEHQYGWGNFSQWPEQMLSWTGHRGWLQKNVDQWKPAYELAMMMKLKNTSAPDNKGFWTVGEIQKEFHNRYGAVIDTVLKTIVK